MSSIAAPERDSSRATLARRGDPLVSPPRHSCLYEGSVRHRRMGAVTNEFRYPLFMAYLDLDELPGCFDGRWLWSARRAALAWFRRSDYLGDPNVPLADAVRELVAERTGVRPDGPIRLLTHLRYFGKSFNPVSFYYCYDAAGEHVRAVIADVTNTPWGERHAYVMPVESPADRGTVRLMRAQLDKQLHVSPLMGMDHIYDWRLTEPNEQLLVHIESHRANESQHADESQHAGEPHRASEPLRAGRPCVFDATLSLRRRELTPRALRRALVRYPFLTARILARIYTHALRLKLRGAKYFPHPENGSAADMSSTIGPLRRTGPLLKTEAVDAPMRGARAKASLRDRLARRLVLRLLRKIKGGELTIVENEVGVTESGVTAESGVAQSGERLTFGDVPALRPLRVTLEVRSPRFYRALLRGSVGLCESYMDGLWVCEDLVALTRIAALNVSSLDNLRRVLAPVLIPMQRWMRWLRSNTIGRSRRQIAAHYDLGNELFGLFLDPTMMYSCAVFDSPEATLEEASLAKLERVCAKLALSPSDHVLEIGTGWGGFAIYAAAHYGCRVTTTTISREQHAYATERVRAEGLEQQVTVLLEDYRDLHGSYDKLVSIEMIEAVGWQNFPTYFRRCSELLSDDGAMLLQAIVIDDRAYQVEKASKSFINTYIFPGGCLPSLEVISRQLPRVTDFRQVHLEDITAHYATTLALWRERFLNASERLADLGYDERFRRLWELYLCYCEGGFRERRIQDIQLLLAKPGYRAESTQVVSLAA